MENIGSVSDNDGLTFKVLYSAADSRKFSVGDFFLCIVLSSLSNTSNA